MENPELVEMTYTYFKNPDGSITEVVKIAGQEVRRGPSPVVFFDGPDRPPWWKEEEDASDCSSDEDSNSMNSISNYSRRIGDTFPNLPSATSTFLLGMFCMFAMRIPNSFSSQRTKSCRSPRRYGRWWVRESRRGGYEQVTGG